MTGQFGPSGTQYCCCEWPGWDVCHWEVGKEKWKDSPVVGEEEEKREHQENRTVPFQLGSSRSGLPCSSFAYHVLNLLIGHQILKLCSGRKVLINILGIR